MLLDRMGLSPADLMATTGPGGQCRPSPSTSRETCVVVVSRVVTLGSRSGPRWLMALADCHAAEMLGVLDAWFG
jgi:hypothetical protein